MTWPFEWDTDRIAQLFNSVCGTLISAVIIFVFIYYNRKKPVFKIYAVSFNIGRNGATQLITDPVPYVGTIYFNIQNDSIYTAYNFNIDSLDTEVPNDADYKKEYGNIESNGFIRVTIQFYLSFPKISVMKDQPESWELDRAFVEELTKKYKKPFFTNVSYRNADNRKIHKKLKIIYT